MTLDLETLQQPGSPGPDLIREFVATGEYGVVDVIEAWRACSAVLCAFLEITPRQLLNFELLAANGIDAEPREEALVFVRQKLVDDRVAGADAA